ncbi:hypothetical protein B5M09_008078 [Aphanomyces astaci]|uniref:Kinetochore protein SPC25 n=1 Tax=Aphanomyces astaci TaxID=112090 RepID=A0A425DM70_APHAT|nr:hypothetical protein B5M09_008078 [Aphanomyces astaci]
MADSLETHLEATARALSTWVENEKATLEETKQIFSEEMEKDRQQLQNLMAKKEQLATAASTREETRSEKLRTIQGSQSEVRLLQAEMSTSEPVVLGLRAQKALHDSKLSNFTHDVSQASQAHALSVPHDPRPSMPSFTYALDKNLSFVFTQIDRDVPSREFTFSLRIRSDSDLFVGKPPFAVIMMDTFLT